jgi:adenosylcobinamide kinase/adenosylcobinamide-phosphate guanylyltransferase
MYVFVSGGYRSGRSNYALRRAAELGAPPWCYLSGGSETDDAIRKRIEHQRKDKEAIWETFPMPDDLDGFLAQQAPNRYGAIVLDGFAHWLEGRIMRQPALTDHALLGEIEELGDRLYRSPTPVVLVTREVGLARLPGKDAGEETGEEAGKTSENRLVRMVTSANQLLAESASGIVFMISGIPLRVR